LLSTLRRRVLGVISVFVQIVAVALWRRVQHANTPSALQNRDDSHENRGHPFKGTTTRSVQALFSVQPLLRQRAPPALPEDVLPRVTYSTT